MDRRGVGSRGASLLEREREFALLEGVIEQAAIGEARVVVIEGAPGLGKTSLIGWADGAARARGFTVLRARGGALEQTLGWGVARQLFEGVLARAKPATRRSLLSGSAAHAAPALGLAGGEPQPDGPVKDFHLEHGLYWLVCNLGDRAPVAMLIDDVQWCDEATLGWLLYLVRRSEQLPLVVVLATRSGEQVAASGILELIAAEPVARTVELATLGVGATEALLERAYGGAVDQEFGRACHEWTGGNPLFVVELATELAAEGVEPTVASAPAVKTLTPEGISRVVLLRLARLSDAALALARAIAVLESAAEVHYAADLAERPQRQAVAALDELTTARVLAPERPLRFSHPLIGGVVYDDIPPGRRETMHRRAAQLLIDARADPGRIAAHLLRSAPGGDPVVVSELRRAGRDELAAGSPSTAVQLLRRARAEPPQADAIPGLLAELGRSELLAGDPAGTATLRDALAATSNVRERARLTLMLGTLLVGAGDGAATVEVAGAVAEELGWDDVDLRLQLEGLIVNAARSESSLLGLIPEHLRVARERSAGDGYGSRLIAAQLSWGLTAIAAPADRAAEFARAALAGGRLIAEAANTPDAYLGAIHMLSFNDALDEADEQFARAIALAQKMGSAPAYSAGSCFRANAAYLRGRLGEAELLARDALRTASESGVLALIRGLASAYLGLVLVARGAVEEARAFVPDDREQLEHAAPTWATELMFTAGCAAVATGRLDDGVAWLLGCGRRALAWGVLNPAWIPWRSEAALALLALGDRGRAADLVGEELELARRVGARRPLGIALRASGLVEGGAGGIELLRESEDALASSPARLEHARTLVALGAALRRANSRAKARSALEQGLTLAHRCDAAPLVEQARTELVAAGARPRSVLRDGAQALTPSERRVCQLAASGKSNPEIAQLLFVTRATVESHLHSAYRKLDISARSELAGALPDLAAEARVEA